MVKLRGHVITVAVAAGVAVAFVIYFLANFDALPKADPYTVRAEVPSAVALAPGASVRVAGLEVGRVTSIGRRGGVAVLGLEVDDEHAPIPRDSRHRVRLRTMVGENYVDLIPGRSASRLPNGATLPLSRSGEYVEVDQILSVLRGQTRERAKHFFQGLGYGVRDRGPQLNRFLDNASGTIEEGVPVTHTLWRDRRQVARLVENFGDVSRAVGERGAAVRQMASGMRTTFAAVAARDQALREMLEQMPSTLRQVRETSGVVRSVTGQVAPVLTDLGLAVRELDPAIRSLAPASEEGRGFLAELRRSAPPLEGTLSRVRELSDPAADALPHVRRTLCQANPALEYLSPYAEDVGQFFGTFLASGANPYDGVGHYVRLSPFITEETFTAYDEQLKDAAHTLLATGVLGALREVGYDPIPRPGGSANPRGKGVSGPREYPFEYPRVRAEC